MVSEKFVKNRPHDNEFSSKKTCLKKDSTLTFYHPRKNLDLNFYKSVLYSGKYRIEIISN